MNLYLNWHRNCERSKLELQPYVILLPVEIEIQTVPHFEATFNATVEPEGLECDVILISC